MNIDKFWTIVDASGDCWIWTGAKSSSRGKYYGNLSFNGQYKKAHIVAWETLVGPVPSGMELDHLCRNTLCVNPDHIEPTTHKENCIRGSAGNVTRNRQKQKTHCLRGHEFDSLNTMKRKDGSRDCRECKNGLRRGEYIGWVV